MKQTTKWYLIGLVVAFGGLFLLLSVGLNPEALGEIFGVLVILVIALYVVVYYLLEKREQKKKGSGR